MGTKATPILPGSPLRPIELRIVSLIAEGKGTREVAQELKLGADTVKVYISGIYRRVGLMAPGSRRVALANLYRSGKLGTLG